MAENPFERFLGVSDAADAFRLLQLTPGQTHATAVQRALENQLERVNRHPDSRSAGAAFMRERLNEAARAILEGRPAYMNPPRAQKQAPDPKRGPKPSRGAAPPQPVRSEVPLRPARFQPPPTTVPTTGGSVTGFGNGVQQRLELTPFDRQVLAILVASGGWNRESRARLVGVASANSVSPGGLMKVVSGLSRYAGSHGETRLDVAQITQGESLDLSRVISAESTGPGSPAFAEAAAMTPHPLEEELHLEGGGMWATIKLSLLFGAATVLLGVLFVNLLIGNDDPGRRGGTQRNQTGGGTTTNLPIQPDGGASETVVWKEDALLLATYPSPPTFMADAAPRRAFEAADRSPRLPDEFDKLARHLTVAETPSRPFWIEWNALTEQTGLCWPLIDRATFNAISENILEALLAAADRPTVTDRLIDDLAAPLERPLKPLALWRGAWAAGMLAEIAGRPDVPGALKRAAITRLEQRLNRAMEPDELSFADSARVWLAAHIAHLISITEFDDSAYQYWELWLKAERAIKSGSSFDHAIMDAVEALLHTSVDLGRPGPTVNVLGRMLSAADFQRSPVVKERILGFFRDKTLDSRDIWVLSSLLAQYDAAPWFDERLVLASGADMEARRALAARVDDYWPQLTLAQPVIPGEGGGAGIAVDPELGGQWDSLVKMQLRDAGELATGRMLEDVELVERLLLASWLNEAAAALAMQDAGEARDVLQRIENGWLAIPKNARAPNQLRGRGLRGRGIRIGTGFQNAPLEPGRARGIDGVWSDEFEQFRTERERIESLRALRSEAGGDLGPRDAQVFISIVYRGSPPALRDEAQQMVMELFEFGPNISVALLDQFSEAPRNDITGDLIAKITGEFIPDSSAAGWEYSAQRALLSHALRLRDSSFNDLAALERALAETYTDQLSFLRPDLQQRDQPERPGEALTRLLQALREEAGSLLVSDPVTGPLAQVERRHNTRLLLAKGPIERHVSAQITALELLAYIIAAEYPAVRNQVLVVLTEAAAARRNADHVLEQAIHAELAMTRLWQLRLEI